MSDNGHRTRTFSWQDPMPSATLSRERSGMEVLQAVIDGALPPPPIAELLGMELVDVQEGRAVFAVEPAEWMYNPIGSVHGGIAATLLDSCMGCAIHSTLPPGVGYTTSDLQIRYSRGMTVDTGRVIADGAVVHAGRRLATAEGRLTVEATGKLIAHATTGCILIS
ncbi:MAG: PaaI family thioesterase [Solirubrobacteraceae bacterium]